MVRKAAFGLICKHYSTSSHPMEKKMKNSANLLQFDNIRQTSSTSDFPISYLSENVLGLVLSYFLIRKKRKKKMNAYK